MTFTFKTDKGWETLTAALDPRQVNAALKKHMRKATRLNGKILEAAVRNSVKGAEFAPNAPLTIMIKHSSKPLVDHGELFKAVSSVIIDDLTCFVGITKNSEKYGLAVAIHDGTEIMVTPAMRGMFYHLWQASMGHESPESLEGRARELWERAPGGWKPLLPSTTRIIMPARPFIDHTINNETIRQRATANWNAALDAAMRDLAAGGK